ncbi:hypothetical protein A1O3_08593 [Capronia epimyces CBS 606.96]|uniref:LIM zinc-binding domain-containing protein n=1 Tax=Capronia epimyces CBS 606.96 TaxID=1182542 RepID=W9XF09_9EURO|nr:uncharacterized protein A1O3_08593 [Capronia epimyces CBS 606.96]EXJ79092.1 hypothetical protein A1O3_08593 [Capronia epimyces CBS 606.96]
MKSRPTSPSTSSSHSTSNKSVDSAPEVQGPKAPEEQPSAKSPLEVEPVAGTTSSPQLSRSYTEPQHQQDARADHTLSAFDFGGTANASAVSTETTLAHLPLEAKSRVETEPAYKSKRPPPLVHDQFPSFTKLRSPTTPQPSSAGVLSKGFGRLFGRRRSQSVTSRREVVRQALSDEPDVYENQFANQGFPSARSDQSFLIAEPSPLPPPRTTSPTPLASHEESLKALEGIAPAPNPTPIMLVEPTGGEEPFQSPLAFPREVEPPEASDPITTVPEPEHKASEAIESIQRTSIDSASSYASVGFSERATSSRSSSPHTESLAVKSFDSSVSNLLQHLDAEMPAPLRPGRAQTCPDSPTDPLFQQGHLSPIPDLRRGANEVVHALQSAPVGPPISATPTQEPKTALPPKSKGATPNKGVCRGCSQVILVTQKSVSSADGRLTGRYHKECFVCQTCQSIFPTAEFYVHNDQPYCAYHYHELENSLCATCGKGIEGLYMETANVAGRGKEKHHAECLKCTTCKIRLDHDYFELSGNVYCERDAFRMASMPKSRDNAPSRPSPLIREYISSGDHGLLRGRNFPERRTTRLMTMT